MALIGPNFANELNAAGLLGLPFAWSPDGTLTFSSAMTNAQKNAVQTVLAAHDPNKPEPNSAAAALFRGGLAVTSITTSALNGTYGLSPQDETNIIGLQVAVTAGVFPGWYRDMAGTKHAMTPTQFTALATALLAAIVAIEEAKDAALAPGGVWVAPTMTATIT